MLSEQIHNSPSAQLENYIHKRKKKNKQKNKQNKKQMELGVFPNEQWVIKIVHHWKDYCLTAAGIQQSALRCIRRHTKENKSYLVV